jgi:hypothetical protein
VVGFPKAPSPADDRHQSRFAGALHKTFVGNTMIRNKPTFCQVAWHTFDEFKNCRRQARQKAFAGIKYANFVALARHS